MYLKTISQDQGTWLHKETEKILNPCEWSSLKLESEAIKPNYRSIEHLVLSVQYIRKNLQAIIDHLYSSKW
jgi:hypothetical protein